MARLGVKGPSNVTSVMTNTTLDHWFYPWFSNPGGSGAILISRANPLRSRSYSGVRFRISRRLLEEQSGVKMDLGKLYELTGQIEGVCDFHAIRAGTTNDILLLTVPVEHLKSVVPHELYQIRFDSVIQRQLDPELMELVGRTRKGRNWKLLDRVLSPVSTCTTGPFHGPCSLVGKVYEVKTKPIRYRFDFWRPTFETKAGYHFETGLTYLIRGKVVGKCDFEAEHVQTEYNKHVQFEVPAKWRSSFRHGETYEIKIESIVKKEVILSEAETRLGAVWDWVMVAAWIDTEGCYVANANQSLFTVTIYQKEKLPLTGICAFLRSQGIGCAIYHTVTENPRNPFEKIHAFALTIAGPEDLAKVIVNTEPYIRTQNKRKQIAHCKEELAKPRVRLREPMIRARLLLGIPLAGKSN